MPSTHYNGWRRHLNPDRMLDFVAELIVGFVQAVFSYLFGGPKGRRVFHWIIVLAVLGALGYGTYWIILESANG